VADRLPLWICKGSRVRTERAWSLNEIWEEQTLIQLKTKSAEVSGSIEQAPAEIGSLKYIAALAHLDRE
jgi:hypothetical protein